MPLVLAAAGWGSGESEPRAAHPLWPQGATERGALVAVVVQRVNKCLTYFSCVLIYCRIP